MKQPYQPGPKLPLLQPYPLVRETLSNGIEIDTFTTDSGITYKLFFDSLARYIPEESFADDAQQLVFDTASADWRKGADPRIAYTVVTVLKNEFAAQPNLILMFNCRTADRLGRMRSITFGRWLAEHGDNYEVVTYRKDDDMSAVVFRRDHPATVEIRTCFDWIFYHKSDY